jgi:hypothetical protein
MGKHNKLGNTILTLHGRYPSSGSEYLASTRDTATTNNVRIVSTIITANVVVVKLFGRLTNLNQFLRIATLS